MPPPLVSGGTQRHLLEVLKFIDRERFRPLVVSAKSGGELGAAIRACDVELVELNLGDSMISMDLARCVRETAAVFRRRRVDIVQYFAWRPGLIGIAATRLAGRGRTVAGRRSAPREQGVRSLLEDLVVRLADRVIVNAESLRPRGRVALRTEIVPSGVDTERFHARTDEREGAKARLGVPTGRRLIGTVGRLEERKGTLTLIEAAAHLAAQGAPEFEVAVAGDGPQRNEIANRAAALGITRRVHLLGDRADVREVLAALDVFVLPSRTEGMSNALLEAMAMERPVVATAVGGTPEVVVPAVSGLLVPPADPQAIAAAVGRLLTDPRLATELGAAARCRVVECYGVGAMVRRLEDIYEAVATAGDNAARAQRVRTNGHP